MAWTEVGSLCLEMRIRWAKLLLYSQESENEVVVRS